MSSTGNNLLHPCSQVQVNPNNLHLSFKWSKHILKAPNIPTIPSIQQDLPFSTPFRNRTFKNPKLVSASFEENSRDSLHGQATSPKTQLHSKATALWSSQSNRRLCWSEQHPPPIADVGDDLSGHDGDDDDDDKETIAMDIASKECFSVLTHSNHQNRPRNVDRGGPSIHDDPFSLPVKIEAVSPPNLLCESLTAAHKDYTPFRQPRWESRPCESIKRP
ncbi:hypothetical protein HK102_012060, partial [Quaeritorhiza haematococci]